MGLPPRAVVPVPPEEGLPEQPRGPIADPLARLRPLQPVRRPTPVVADVAALIGVIVAAIPILFEFHPYYVPLILAGSGIAVVALAIFLSFSAAPPVTPTDARFPEW